MALTPTLLQDAIVLINGGSFGDFEKRHDDYGALQAFGNNAEQLLSKSQIENMKKSVVQTTKVPVVNRYSPSVITDPTCSITGGRPTSAFASLTYAFVGFEIQVIPEQNEANYVTEAEDIAAQMAGGWRGLFENLDTKAVTALETNKSTSLVTSSLKNVTTNAGNYDYAGDPLELFLNVPALMKINSINGPYEDIANTEAMATMARIDAFGVNNYYDAKGAIARNGSFRHYMTNRITAGDGNREAHYITPAGSIGVYNWVDYSAKQGFQAGNKKWDTMQDPMFGFDWRVYSVSDCVDDNAVSGNASAYGYKAQIGAWFAFLTQYHSSTASPIIKIARQDPA